MRLMKVMVLVVLQCIAVILMFAQQPHLEITLADSLTVPFSYDYVIQLPNSDLQFYKLNYGTTSIQINGFQYLSAFNQITPEVDLGTVSNLAGLYPLRSYKLERHGNLYLVHQLPSGLVLIKLEQNTLLSRTINEYSLGQHSDIRRVTEIVSENAMAIALADSLVYYNFVDGSTQTLLQGPEYQCEGQQYPTLISLPDSYFMYVKDVGGGDQQEVWVVFDSNGQYLFTQISSDPDLLMTLLGENVKLIHGKWYIPAPTIVYTDGWLECHMPEPDSLHFYLFGAPSPIDEAALSFSPFGEDRILRLYYNEFWEAISMYCNYSPLELFPEVLFTYFWGNSYPIVTSISEDISTMTVRSEDHIAIRALWTYDFPEVHEFSFPIASNPLLGCTAFADNDFLRVITNQKVYSYHIEISTSLADETMDYLPYAISAYPNPVRSRRRLMIESKSTNTSALDIYNIRGQKVRSLQLGKEKQVEWDLRDNKNMMLPSGVYIIKARNDRDSKLHKLVILD